MYKYIIQSLYILRLLRRLMCGAYTDVYNNFSCSIRLNSKIFPLPLRSRRPPRAFTGKSPEAAAVRIRYIILSSRARVRFGVGIMEQCALRLRVIARARALILFYNIILYILCVYNNIIYTSFARTRRP